MKAVFDTNILVDYLNGYAAAKTELRQYKKKLISIITYMEVLVGARNDEEEQTIRSFLSSFEFIGLTEEIADEAVRIRKIERLKVPDSIVYATARTQGCMLVSRNTKDFRSEWPDVRVPYVL